MKRASARPWGVVFDIDGTIVDNAAYHERAWIELGRRHGLPIDQAYYRERIHGHSNQIIVRRMFGEEGDFEAGMTLAEEKEAIYREIYRPHVKETPGFVALVRSLYECGVPIVSATNAPPANAQMVLEELGVAAMFRAVFTPDDGFPGKPAPDMLLAAASSIEAPIGQCLVFEDSPAGFRAAESAGAPYIAITFGADPRHPAQAKRALRVLRDFTDLTPEALLSLLHEAARRQA